MKKILSLVLVLSLVLGTFSFAFAATPPDVVGEDSEKAVETLMALGVVDGYDDGTYKPEKMVTRAEMVKLIIEAQGYGELAEGSTTTFVDAQGHWAEKYIGFAASMKIVKGYPDGTFKPNEEMSVNEALAMVIRALGYTDEVLKGSWPTNYKVKALDLGLTDDMSSLSGFASRADVAILFYNALEAELVEVYVNSEGLHSIDKTDKMLLSKIGEEKTEKIDYVDVYDADDALTVADGIDLEQYLYNTITYYGTDDYDVAYVSDVEYDTYEGYATYTSTDAITVEIDSDNDKAFSDIATSASFFFNGNQVDDITSISAVATSGAAEVKVVYDDDKGDAVKGVIVWQSEAFQITNEYSSRRPLELQRYLLPEDDDGELDVDSLMVEGDVDTLEEIAEDDIVHLYSSEYLVDGLSTNVAPDKMKIVVARDTFEGKATKKATDFEQVVVGGSTFNLSDFQTDNFSSLVLGESYTLYFDKDGDVFTWTDLEADVVAEGYGVFVTLGDGSVVDDQFGEKSLDDVPAIKIFTSGGDVVTYNIDTSGLSTTYTGISTLGAIALDGNGTTITASAVVSKGALIKYDLNSDDEVSNVTTASINTYGAVFDETEMLLGNYDVVDNTLIFNISVDVDDEDTWEVIEASSLSSNITGQYVNDGFDVETMTVVSGMEVGNVYAAVIDSGLAINSDDDEVYELTLLEGGVEKTYLTSTKEQAYEDFATTDGFVKLSLDSGEVTTVEAIALATSTNTAVKIDTVEDTRIQGTIGEGDYVFKLANDVVVYVIDDGDFEAKSLEYIMKGDYVNVVGTSGGNAVTNSSISSATDVEVIVIDLDLQ